MPAQAERLDIMSVKIITKSAAVTLQELMSALQDLAEQHPDANKGVHILDTTYITINSDSIRLALVEETLTDGSKVYNIELSEACK